MRRFIALPLIATMLVGGCARNMQSNTYTSDATVGKVLEGTVIAAAPITIKNTDKLENNGMGMLGGGIVGGIAGSAIGDGTGQALATAGAALAGAAIGAVMQDKLGTNNGMQYVVRLDPKYVKQSPIKKEHHTIDIEDHSVDSDVKGSMDVAGTQTDLISIIQANDVIFQPGQHVLIVYNNDRPRLMAGGSYTNLK